jgi:hypothetical protein
MENSGCEKSLVRAEQSYMTTPCALMIEHSSCSKAPANHDCLHIGARSEVRNAIPYNCTMGKSSDIRTSFVMIRGNVLPRGPEQPSAAKEVPASIDAPAFPPAFPIESTMLTLALHHSSLDTSSATSNWRICAINTTED